MHNPCKHCEGDGELIVRSVGEEELQSERTGGEILCPMVA